MFGYVRFAWLAAPVFLLSNGTLVADPPGPSSRRTSWVISEVMYHPPNLASGQELEFIEIYNAGLIAEDLAGYRLSGDWDFVFPTNTLVAAGGFVVVAPAPANLMAAYGISGVLGGFTNRLANDEGRVRLRNPANAILLEVEYADSPPWPAAADGGGHSLVLSRPGFGERDPRAWAASAFVRGSPGQPEPSVPTDAPVGMINELLTHTDDPQLDYLEILNPSDREIDYSGCRLTDDPAKPGFRIPSGSLLPPRGLAAFDQDQLGFALDAAGETLFLFTADDQRVLDAIRFGPQANGVSFGRWPDGSLEWSALSAPTFASTNSPPRQPEVVISEIFYHPISEDSDDEFLELHNLGTQPIDLGDWELQDGIEFVFPLGTVLPAGGYLAVARNAARLLTNHPGLTAPQLIGNYRGTLSDAGERVALARPELLITTNTDLTLATNRVAIVVNEVTYGDGGRWGQWSDGGGSSLELRDARADNRLASAWADSDESAKAPWTVIESSGTLDLGVGSIDSLQVLLQGPGACLVDDVQVLTSDSVNHIANGNFAGGTAGWAFEGTHATSQHTAEEGATTPGSLQVQAVGRGDTGANRIRTPVTAGLNVGATATLRASARWQRGSPDLLLRLRGNYLEAAGRLTVPANLGTPGRPNSRAAMNAPPAIWEIAHDPVLPRAGGLVRVSARVLDPDGLNAVELRYRVDPATTYSTIAMLDNGTSGDRFAGDGIFTALLPGQAAGQLVAYQVYARDASVAMASALFPDEAPRVEALIRYGESRPMGQLGVYRLWMTQATFNQWANRSKLDNAPLPVTFVYNDERVVHGVGAIYAGSPHISPGYNTPSGNLCGYVLSFPEDEPFLNAREIVLDWPGRDSTAQQEPMAYWLARELGIPFNHRRYIRLHVNGRTETQRGSIYEDAQQVNSDLIESWLPDATGGDLFKIEQWFEYDDNGGIYQVGAPRLENYTTTEGAKKTARYRWCWLPRAVQGSPHDFGRLFTLVDVANANDPEVYTRQTAAFIDLEEWMRIFATEHMMVNLDSWGYDIGKNMYAYKPPRGPWQLYMWDIDWVMLPSAQHGYSPTSPLMYRGASPFGDGNRDPVVGRMYNHPAIQRAYWRAIQDAVDGPLLPERVADRMDATYAALVAQGVTQSSGSALTGPAAVKDWLLQRRNFLLTQLATVAAPFTVQSVTMVSNNIALVTGTAPITVAHLRFNGVPYPATWSTVTDWQVPLPLAEGANPIVITGVDLRNRQVPGAAAQRTLIQNGPLADGAQSLVINEIQYYPADSGAGFVELFNRSTNTAFDLSGWALNGTDLTFPSGTWLAPGAYAVAANDRERLAETYGIDVAVAAQFDGQLRNDGETLQLVQPVAGLPDSRIINQVTYDDEPPWPTTADGSGPSLQLVDPYQDNRRPGNWIAVPEPTPVPPQTLVPMTQTWRYDATGTDLGSAWRDPTYLDAAWPEGAALLYNETAALPAPKNTLLPLGHSTYYFRTHFSFNGDPSSMALSLTTVIDDAAVFYLNGHPWHWLGLSANTPIDYTTLSERNVPDATQEGPFLLDSTFLRQGDNVLAVEVHQIALTSSDITFGLTLEAVARANGAAATPGRPNATFQALPAIPNFWINELQAVNNSSPRDRFDEAEPWVELFNAGTTAASLDGVYLTDTATNLTRWAFPAGTAIGAGEWLVVWLDAEPQETGNGELHASFRPSGGAGFLALVATVAGQPFVLDSIHYAGLQNGYVLALLPDGNPDDRRIVQGGTPGAINSVPPGPTAVRFNEWMAVNQGAASDPADGDYDDWLELYNALDVPADLTGCFLTDDPADLHQFAFPAGTIIPAHGFLLCWADEEGSQTVPGGALHLNFRLSQAGEQLLLVSPKDTILDAVIFEQQNIDRSEGRWPDGGANLARLSLPTPGSANTPPEDIGGPPHILGIVKNPTGSCTVTWSTAAGGLYRLQICDDLALTNWQDATLDLLASGSSLSATDPAPPDTERYYRIVRLMP